MASSQTILSLFNSRKNIIELLGELNFNIEDYGDVPIFYDVIDNQENHDKLFNYCFISKRYK